MADYLFKLVFVWITISSAIMSLKHGKWLPTVSAIAKVTLLVFFVGTTVVYAAQHGVQGIGFGDLAPSTVGFLGLVPVVLYAFLGFEAGNGAGGEMRSAARDVPVSLARSAAVAAGCYLLPIVAILVVLPSSAITGVSGLMDAIVTVYSVYGDAADVMITVTAVALVLVLIGQGAAWMIVGDRTQATVAADGAFFGGFFGVFSERFGTPLRINLLTGAVASLFLVAAMTMVEGAAGAVFKVTLSLCVSTYLMAYLLMIPAAAKLRRQRPADATSYRLPVSDRTFSLFAYVATAWVVLGSFVALFPGTLEGLLGIDYDFEERWGVSRVTFETFTLGTMAVLLALGILGYVRAARVRTASVASTPRDPDPAATV